MTKEHTTPERARTADILYDAFFSGAVGGSIVAIFFLFFDVIQGRPLHTPSMLGSVMFLGADAHAALPIRYDMVALNGIVHFLGFAAVGLAVALIDQALKLHNKRPLTAVLAVFVVNVMFFGAAGVLMPGVIAELGIARIVIANVLAAAGMMLAVSYGHRGGALRAMSRGDLSAEHPGLASTRK